LQLLVKLALAARLMKHVYHPDRLIEQKGCITVTGVIVKKLKEKDGDFMSGSS